MNTPPWITVEDYKLPGGWIDCQGGAKKSRAYCEMAERGQILFFRNLPFELPGDDQNFLRQHQWTELRMHKNVSYRPSEDVLRGVSGDAATVERMHSIMRNYSARIIEFVGTFLSPYSAKWNLDFASFRPLEEAGRALPVHKRNDLLHVDAFPSRPTRGGRILRVFTNLNPTQPRVWNTTEDFDRLARQFAKAAGLMKIAEDHSLVGRTVQKLGAKLGIGAPGRTPYDEFMLRFHDFLKKNAAFQANCLKTRLEFPPSATWIVFTDGVAHAAISGQYAIEQTFLIPPTALVAPEAAPCRILEQIAGRPLVS
ncbi:MAG: Kdo hydroxylase family protein [Candidatus Acidiferrales bacterium]